MVRVVTQSEAQKRRRMVTFCYLCGRDLNDREKRTREHIVPKAVLGSPAFPAWALVVDVHESCERHGKRDSDALFALWQRLFLPAEEKEARTLEVLDAFIEAAQPTSDDARLQLALAAVNLAAAWASTSGSSDISGLNSALDQWVDVLGSATDVSSGDTSRVKTYLAALFDWNRYLSVGHYRNTPFKAVEGVSLDCGQFALDGFNSVMAAVWIWVRGFHALTYGSFLPDEAPHVVLTPLPLFSGTSSPRPFVDDRVHRTVLATLDAAEQANKLHRVQDGARCDFRSAWVHRPDVKSFARCVWRLDVPGPLDTRSWWGYYDMPLPPNETELLTQSDFASYNDRPQVH